MTQPQATNPCRECERLGTELLQSKVAESDASGMYEVKCTELAKALKEVEYLNGVILNLKDTIRELRLALGQEDRR